MSHLMRASPLLLGIVVLIPSAAAAQGNPVGPEFRVNTYTIGNQQGPTVTSDASGNVVFVWGGFGQDGSGFGVFGQRHTSSGVPVGPEFRVNTYTTGNQGGGYSQRRPRVASDASGNFVVVWDSDAQDASSGGIFGQRYASSGAPVGAEFRINTYTTNEQSFPSVASDAAGGFVVAWQSDSQDGSFFGIFAQRYVSSGAPFGSEFRVNSYTTSDQRFPSVSTDPSGNFVVAWQSYTQDGSSSGIFGQRYASSGAPIGPEFPVNTYTTSWQSRPSVATDASGNFVVVWHGGPGQDGSDSGVFGQRYAASGTPLGPEFLVNTYTTSWQSYPSVAADSTGNFVVVWNSYVGLFDTDILGQRYASSGTPLGPEFPVNSSMASTQWFPAVAADSSGNFVVVWESYQDGSGNGVFGQRYSQIVPVELMHFRIE